MRFHIVYRSQFHDSEFVFINNGFIYKIQPNEFDGFEICHIRK